MQPCCANNVCNTVGITCHGGTCRP
jgi:hypothetical protein